MSSPTDSAARLLALRNANVKSLATQVPKPRTAEADMGITLQPGAKVLDKLTGLEGVVISGRVEHSTVAPAESGNPPGANPKA